MIEEPAGRIDYEETGEGPTIVFVPGSCSTGAAWRPVMTALGAGFRYVTTSLLGYGGTAERRTASDPSISHEIDMAEAVIRRAAAPVHLVGHSFGGLVSLAVALRARVPIASLTIVEAPAVELLRALGETEHYRAFRDMNEVYFTAFRNGEENAIAAMIDFYGGAGTFASWPPRVRAYAVETTAVNILDWASAYGFPLRPSAIAAIDLPTLVLRGGISQPAVQRANELLSIHLKDASLVTIAGGAHFMIATHAGDVARAIGEHVKRVEKLGTGQQ
jgi:pimeloyl-ACP methyl ester carboxylesterase